MVLMWIEALFFTQFRFLRGDLTVVVLDQNMPRRTTTFCIRATVIAHRFMRIRGIDTWESDAGCIQGAPT